MSTLNVDLRNALVTEIVSQALPYPTQYPNAPFTTPNNEPWLRVSFINNQPVQTTLGSNGRDRIDGFMQIDVFTPKTTGNLKALQIADEINTNLKSGDSLTSNGLELRIVSVGARQGTDDSAWYHQLVRVDYYTQYTRL